MGGYRSFDDGVERMQSVELLHYAPHLNLIRAQTEGSQGLYTQKIRIRHGRVLSECTCPSHYHPCKHSLAVMLVFAQDKQEIDGTWGDEDADLAEESFDSIQALVDSILQGIQSRALNAQAVVQQLQRAAALIEKLHDMEGESATVTRFVDISEYMPAQELEEKVPIEGLTALQALSLCSSVLKTVGPLAQQNPVLRPVLKTFKDQVATYREEVQESIDKLQQVLDDADDAVSVLDRSLVPPPAPATAPAAPVAPAQQQQYVGSTVVRSRKRAKQQDSASLLINQQRLRSLSLLSITMQQPDGSQINIVAALKQVTDSNCDERRAYAYPQSMLL